MTKLILDTKKIILLCLSIILCIGLWSCADDLEIIDSSDGGNYRPVITEVKPLEAQAGDTIIITGRNLSIVPEENAITFNGIAAKIVEVNSTEYFSHTAITTIIPAEAKEGTAGIVATVGSLASDSTAFEVVKYILISIDISEAGDDAEELRKDYDGDVAGDMSLTSSDLEMCTEAEDLQLMIGLIFRNVQIPVGAEIVKAYIQFTCDDNDNQEGPLPINVQGIKEANTSAPFTYDLFSVSSRPSTIASITWDAPIWDTKNQKGPNEATSDIASIVQEIIDQDGWASGNNMGFKLFNDETKKIHREAEAWDEYEGAGNAPQLVIAYKEESK